MGSIPRRVLPRVPSGYDIAGNPIYGGPPPFVPPPGTVIKTPDTTPSYGDDGSYITRESGVDVTDTAEDQTCYVAYGETQLHPWLVLVESAPPVFRFVFLVSEGPIDAYEHIYYENQEIYPTSMVSGVAVVEMRTGTNAQAKITECAAADWISNHPGKALICVEINTAVAPMSGGQPNIMVQIRGLLANAGAYTQNPVLIAEDMLTNVEYGAGVPSAFLDSTSWAAAVARCDELVNAKPRWQANFILQQRTPPISVIRDFLAHTCGARLYSADGQWHITFDDQHVIGNRATPDTATTGYDLAQSFLAPGVRIKPVLAFQCITTPTAVTLRLRSTLAGADLATSTKTVPVTGDYVEVAFDEFAGLTYGSTYYLVVLNTANIYWARSLTDKYSYGCGWYYSAGWVAQTTYDFWFQVHYCDAEIVRWKDRVAGQIPAVGSVGKGSLAMSRSHLDAPNVVTANCLDTTTWAETPVQYMLPGMQAGTDTLRWLRMGTLPSANPDQLYRLVKQWALVAQETLTGNIEVMLHGACLAPGDVVSLFPTPGVAASSWYRIRSISTSDNGYTLEFYPYNFADFSRDETYTPVAFTIPNAQSTAQYQTLEDDFPAGGGTDGTIGQYNWGCNGYASGFGYTSETNHTGILTFRGQTGTPYNPGIIGSGIGATPVNLIATGGLNYYRAFIRCLSGNYGGTFSFGTGNQLKLDRAANLLYKWSGGGWVSLALAPGDAWVTFEVWGNGAGNATCKVTVPSVGTATWATTGNATTPTENWTFAGLDGRGYIAIDDIKYATSTAR